MGGLQETGTVWGGRARGGRGIRGNNDDSCISIENFQLAFMGNQLLTKAKLKLNPGHIYGLIGENGVGKSTLIRCMARRAIPGFSLSMNIQYMQQELLESPDITVLQYIREGMSGASVGAGVGTRSDTEERMQQLTEAENALQKVLDETDVSDEEALISLSEEISIIAEQIENLQDKKEEIENGKKNDSHLLDYDAHYKEIYKAIPETGRDILRNLGLGLKRGMLCKKMHELSGGWRMRATLAHTLLQSFDLLLLDEPTNHLDIGSILWLQQYLVNLKSAIVVIVSHDRSFLDSTCTDIIHIKKMTLNYFAGNYSSWLSHTEEMKSRAVNMVDARGRQEERINKSNESNARKEKKLERSAMQSRLDGKKFKINSIKKLSEKFYHGFETVSADDLLDDRSIKFSFPVPNFVDLRLSSALHGDAAMGHPLISFEDCTINSKTMAGPKNDTILSKVNFQLTSTSRIGIIGPNGGGKSTFLTALSQLADGQQVHVKKGSRESDIWDGRKVEVLGNATCHPNLRIGVLSQHHLDNLDVYLEQSSVDFLVQQSRASSSSSSVLEVRSLLGKFGLSGHVVFQKIGSLSGGQKARLCLCAAFLYDPHVLLLDEPSNHFSLNAIEALITGLREFKGALVVISHNKHMLSSVCCCNNGASALVVIDEGKLTSFPISEGSEKGDVVALIDSKSE